MTHGTLIRWLGQACFLITTLSGMHILIDPPHPEVGYKIAAHTVPADIVFVSHEHPDHNFVEAASGTPTIVPPVTAPGPAQSGGYGSIVNKQIDLSYTRIFSYHDNVQGSERGTNTITVLHVDGLRICHLGDLGQLALTPDQLREIGKVDILMIPVGGFFTIDAQQAVAIIDQLHPSVIIPIHYRTDALNADLRSKLHPISEFEAAMAGHARVVHLKARDLDLSPSNLPAQPVVYILRYQ